MQNCDVLLLVQQLPNLHKSTVTQHFELTTKSLSQPSSDPYRKVMGRALVASSSGADRVEEALSLLPSSVPRQHQRVITITAS
eukprot:413008-Rhodomonas_salina.1